MDMREQLIIGHERLGTLLQLLQAEVTAGKSGDNADLQLMQEIVNDYAEDLNRAGLLEEQFIEDMLRRGIIRRQNLDRTAAEHRDLTRGTHRLVARLDQARQSGTVPRQDLIRNGRQMLNANLDHLAREKQSILVLVGDSAHIEDWPVIDSPPTAFEPDPSIFIIEP